MKESDYAALLLCIWLAPGSYGNDKFFYGVMLALFVALSAAAHIKEYFQRKAERLSSTTGEPRK